jgi:L-seryl-tRNA(Ser) seleniumtransferase
MPHYAWLPPGGALIAGLKKEKPYLTHSLCLLATHLAIAEFKAKLEESPCPFQDREIFLSALKQKTAAYADFYASPALSPLINATGIVIHTNLGRAPLSSSAAKALERAAAYCNLEYDLLSGKRESRCHKAKILLSHLTTAENCLIVNNNAAALILILNTLGEGGEALISRGELLEIGDSFRVSDMAEKSGCVLKEVGAVNKTSLKDYAENIAEKSVLILRVHNSNFTLEGFVSKPKTEELAALAHSKGLILVNDLGSGCLYPLAEKGIGKEPSIRDALKAGADIVCFSGDKLLGGPQAGIILGADELITKMSKNPLYRALRIDKLSLAALEATLGEYLNMENAEKNLPVLRLLFKSEDEINRQSKELCRLGKDIPGLSLETEAEMTPAGGGALPGVLLRGFTVKAEMSGLSDAEFARRLRLKGIIPYVKKGRINLNLRTVENEQTAIMAARIREIAAEMKNDPIPQLRF